jgi:LPS-assembly lipoprotein
MSWSRRQLILSVTAVGGALALGGCVVRPLYSTASDVTADTSEGMSGVSAISIRPIPDRTGQMLHNDLRDLLNPHGQPVEPLYDLEVALDERVRESGLRRTETATRGTLTLRADYILLSRATGELETRGRAQSMVGFNLVDSGFANHVSHQSAQERAIREVAQEIRRRLALYLAEAAS